MPESLDQGIDSHALLRLRLLLALGNGLGGVLAAGGGAFFSVLAPIAFPETAGQIGSGIADFLSSPLASPDFGQDVIPDFHRPFQPVGLERLQEVSLSERIGLQFLQERQASPELISQVTGCIAATRIPQTPTNLMEKIICDADLFHLGTEQFREKSRLLRDELEALKKRLTQEGNIEDATAVRDYAATLALPSQEAEPVSVDCPACSGSGRKTGACARCSGSCRCAMGGGSGTREQGMKGYKERVTCIACKKSGKCPVCAGTGTVPSGPCEKCSGRGKVSKPAE